MKIRRALASCWLQPLPSSLARVSIRIVKLGRSGPFTNQSGGINSEVSSAYPKKISAGFEKATSLSTLVTSEVAEALPELVPHAHVVKSDIGLTLLVSCDVQQKGKVKMVDREK